MNVVWRIVFFVAPVLLAVLWKYTVVGAEGEPDLQAIIDRPARMFDLSVDLVLVATSGRWPFCPSTPSEDAVLLIEVK